MFYCGGEPGIGKSTLILQICDKVVGEGKVLYVSGEESAEQIKMRADRLNIKNEDILFLGETDIDIVNQAIIDLTPKLVIIDSIQTMYSEELSAAAGQSFAEWAGGVGGCRELWAVSGIRAEDDLYQSAESRGQQRGVRQRAGIRRNPDGVFGWLSVGKGNLGGCNQVSLD